ncbi:hypothetical protein [Streptomyces sp. NPDC096030]|uniref:hypothetical protein n=1 Tax=Streptomyces sp. NPDC096030 TaxID=3155423 RepID=UPI003324AAB0
MSGTRDLPGQRLAAGPDDLDDWGAGTAPAGVLRKPPQSLEAGQAVLGTLMSRTGASARYLAETLKIGGPYQGGCCIPAGARMMRQRVAGAVTVRTGKGAAGGRSCIMLMSC